MITNSIKSIERIYPWVLIAPVVLPVVVWGGLIYPYLVPKTLLFYAVSFIAVSMFSLLVAHGGTFFWSRLSRRETWIPGALLALAYVASVFGTDFYRSFWSLFVRGDGLLMLSCAVASFYLILLSADQKCINRLFSATAVVGSFVAVYGIGEWLVSGGRIGGLLGNAAFFAGYLGIAFFATLMAAQTASRGWRRTAYLGAGLQVIAIILSATRGTMLALGVAGFVALVYFAFRRQGPPEPARQFAGVRLGLAARSAPANWRAGSGWARMMLFILVIFGALFFAFRSELATSSFAPIARIASISTSETDVASRLFIWSHMVAEIGQHPWLGVGAEHINVLFNHFYDPTLIYEQWFDRSHNAFLDYAAQYGIGGLLLYIALIASFITTARRFARRGDRPMAELLALLAITYAVQNFFVFDTVSSFWLLLALLAASLAMTSDESPRTELSVAPMARPVSWIIALSLIALLIPVSVRPALAAYDLSQAYKYQLTDVAKEVNYLSHGVALGTYGDLEYGYEAYDMYTGTQAPSLAGQERVDAYHASLAILTTNFDRYTYDARTALYLAHVLTLAPPEVTVDYDLLSSALARSIIESPKRSQAWYILANLSISNANEHPIGSKDRTAGYAAARDLLSRYIALVPALAEPHYVLAQLLYASGDKAGAKGEAEKGRVVYVSDLETAKRAAMYYETVLDLTNAGFFLKEVVRLDPTNAAAQSDLAKIQSYEQSAK